MSIPVIASKEDKTRLRPFMTNWLILSKFLKNTTEEEVSLLMDMEFEDKCRPDIIYRLHARYGTIRRHRERYELTNKISEVWNERERDRERGRRAFEESN